MPERTLTVRIIGDDKSLQQAFKRSEKAGGKFKVGVSGLGAGIARDLVPAAAAIFSVQKALSVLGQSVDEASAINEEVSKSKQIFGDSSKAIIAWADTTARSIGVSKREALEASGVFGNLFKTVGLAPSASAQMSQALVQLSADLASFNNADPSDVLEAIRSGLIGEAEPLRRYGVLLSETRVQQRAMADTGKSNATALTNQEKALARYEIILQDTKSAQGDFARTSGGLANQQRILAANTADLEAKLGSKLLPTLVLLTSDANDAIAALERLGNLDITPGFHIPHALAEFLAFTATPGKAFAVTLDLLIPNDDKKVLEQLSIAKFAPGTLPSGTPLPGFLPLPTSTPATPHPRAAPDPFGPLKEQDARLRRQALEASRAHRRAQKDFDAFVAGMSLKIDAASITAGAGDDLGALRQLEGAILRRIAAEGRTFKLAQLLIDTRSRIASAVAQQSADAAQASQDAFDSIIDSLSLNLEIAKTTRGFGDDLRALRQLEAQILRRIAAEGRTTALLRQLFENRQEQAQTLNDQRNAAQFEALGLTAEGEKRVAGRSALLRRARSLQDQIKGTVLDTPKTRAELARIVAVLKNTTKKAGRDVRRAILDMLNEISSALEGDSSKSAGPMTRFAKRGIESLVKGLGLTEDQTKEIRQRFSQFNRFDVQAGRRPPIGRTVTPTADEIARHRGDRDVTVNVYIDGSKVEPVVTRRQQKRRGRNAPQRRGVRPGK